MDVLCFYLVQYKSQHSYVAIDYFVFLQLILEIEYLILLILYICLMFFHFDIHGGLCLIDQLFCICTSNIQSLNLESSVTCFSVSISYWNAHTTQNIITITVQVCYIDVIESEIEEESAQVTRFRRKLTSYHLSEIFTNNKVRQYTVNIINHDISWESHHRET